MKSKVLIAACLLLGICLNSCNNGKTAFNKDKLDTVWNDKVQDTFFGLTLGDTMSADSIVTYMQDKGFYFNEYYSTNTLLHFTNSGSKYFSFGGFVWDFLYIGTYNNTLGCIRFSNTRKDKADALDCYNSVKAALDKKYSPTDVAIKDTITYAISKYCGRNKTTATVCCDRYESVGHSIWIDTSLQYCTEKWREKAHDEL